MTSDALSRAIDDAIGGRRQALLDLLTRGSRLPGPRHNANLADAFAQLCRARGKAADKMATALARLTPDEAPGATNLEFLPVCGVLALAARATADPAVRGSVLSELHALADDLRFRVRDSVIEGLARIGGAVGDALVDDVGSWMDGYFHAAAVVRAMAQEPWLPNLNRAEGVLGRLDEAFVLARDAPRAAARYPGHKALLEAIEDIPPKLAARFGVPVFYLMTRWATVKDPVLRELVARTMNERKLAGRFRSELDRVHGALAETEPAPRNPDHDFGPSRDRSGARARARGGPRPSARGRGRGTGKPGGGSGP
jgi:hypothetical protein